MEFLINSVPFTIMALVALCLFLSFRKMKILSESNTLVLNAVESSIEKIQENSRKLDRISVQIENSRKHQQKIFDHHRVILGSLNSQLIKLDLMINATEPPAADGTQVASNAGPASTILSSKGQNFVKIDRDVLPKTEKGMVLLEEVFKRRELSKLPIATVAGKNQPPHMFKDKAEPEEASAANHQPTTTEVPADKNDRLDKAQAPHQPARRKSLLKLFADRPPFAAHSDEQFKRSA